MITCPKVFYSRVSRLEHRLPPCTAPLRVLRLRDCFTRLSFTEELPTALSDLPGSIRESKSRIIDWKVWARGQAEYAVKNRVDHVDNPSLENLLLELDWLLEDNTDAVKDESSLLPESLIQPCSASRPSSEHSWMRISLEELSALWRRRIFDRVPLQYITHAAHWRDLVLLVTPEVLIPRPETELVVDFALEAHNKFRSSTDVDTLNHLERGAWLDLGTGSGAIAIALSRSLKLEPLDSKPRVYAVDVSTAACVVANHNIQRYSMQHIIQLVQSSWFSAFGDGEERIRFAGIISNPPYIPSEQLKLLQPEVQCEPALALDGGLGAGVDSLSEICSGAARYLLDGGVLILETHGCDQSALVQRKLLKSGSFKDIEIRCDYACSSRFVIARRHEARAIISSTAVC